MEGVAQDILFWLADNVETWRRPAQLVLVVVVLACLWWAFENIERMRDD